MSIRQLAFPTAILLVLVVAVLYPRLATPHFGLIDDGVVLQTSSKLMRSFGSGDFGAVFDRGRDNGRFRPAKWCYLTVTRAFAGKNPIGFFLILGASLAVTVLSLCGAVWIATRDRVAGLIAGVTFTLASPTVENYYTVAKDEPALVLWLSLCLLCLSAALAVSESNRGRANGFLAVGGVFLGLAYFSKETAHAMVVVSVAWLAIGLAAGGGASTATTRQLGRFVAISFAWVVVYWGVRWLSGTSGIDAGTYSKRYALEAEKALAFLLQQGAWLIRDFAYLLPLTTFLLARWIFVPAERRTAGTAVFFAAAAWVVAWTGIMLPWGGRPSTTFSRPRSGWLR